MDFQKNINLLDCTLRDGGHVNRALFGKEVIQGIVHSLSKAKTDIVELGFLKNGTFPEDESNFNKIEDIYSFVPETSDSEFSVMIRPDWYDISQLSPCTGKIKYIRFAFYYKDIELTKKQCAYARQNGYKFFLNPVNMQGYSHQELQALLKDVREINPEALTIVDTFGALTQDRLEEIYTIVESEMPEQMIIDLHLHENLNSCFALAQHFLKIKNPNRRVFLDSSLLGMGRVPGNLCTEVMMDYINQNIGESYDINPALQAISRYIAPLKEKYGWGYSPAYYFTGVLKIHRSYAEFLLEKPDLELDNIRHILMEIGQTSKGDTFDKNLVQNIYDTYIQTKEKNTCL